MIEQWINDLNDSDPDVVSEAKTNLIAAGQPAAPQLIAAMCGLQGRQCWQAADVLAAVRTDEAFAALCDMVEVSHPLVSQTAVRSLEAYGVRAVPMLIAALPTAPYMTQLRIVTTFETLGDARAVPVLMMLLPTVTVSSLRYTIIQALGTLGDRQALDVIRTYVDDPDHHVRTRAQRAIERLMSAS